MFTGIIEAVGRIGHVTTSGAGRQVTIEATFADSLRLGDSVAVNGVCLTVIHHNATTFAADLGEETLRVTTLGRLEPGHLVNLERSMPVDGRFGGHVVQGHVDGIAPIRHRHQEADTTWIEVGVPPGLEPYFIHRGSVAVDGVSLTVARLEATSFWVQIVPFTLSHTALGAAAPGDVVNLECDMIGKYVVRATQLGTVNRD